MKYTNLSQELRALQMLETNELREALKKCGVECYDFTANADASGDNFPEIVCKVYGEPSCFRVESVSVDGCGHMSVSGKAFNEDGREETIEYVPVSDIQVGDIGYIIAMMELPDDTPEDSGMDAASGYITVRLDLEYNPKAFHSKEDAIQQAVTDVVYSFPLSEPDLKITGTEICGINQ